ncbi:MAG: DNA mismatch repair endonuclease MutL [Clostridia bacterium]|nr:DNA mismatch repair endonuclease MutL [Clostridia bacterium]
MSKINILPAKVYNRIAAGEVVDRPYSVVKELVENAIDAGATEIEIYVEKGGKQLIRVVDNGSGIERDDLHAAFMPHATSKIAKAEDLENILTLGFRGEAVASIASVSKMTITSKTAEGKCYRLSSTGGNLGEIAEAASGARGTDVTVEDLFFNTPVRLDFLKSDKAEEADITTFIARFILNRSDIAFTYHLNGKKELQSFGGGDEEAMVCVYGASILDNCYKLDAEKHGVRIRGYISNQNFFKSNKSYQSVFLNSRYILNATISSAITGAYSGYAMKRQYPFYVLHIELPPQTVDVNVHPNKTDVRFANNQLVYGCIYSVISAVLDGQSKALDYVVPNANEVAAPTAEKRTERISAASLREMRLEETEREDTVGKTISDGILETAKAEPVKTAPKTNSVFGFETISYEDAKREIELCKPRFSLRDTEPVAKQENVPSKGVTPLSDIGEYRPEWGAPTRKNTAQASQKRKSDPEKLLKQFPGLYFERTVLEVDDPAFEKAKAEGKEEDYFEANKRYLEELDRQAKQNKIEVASCKYAGKLFNTYLLYERGEEVYIIDQHAAHERLIFDRLKAQMQNRSVVRQPMLLPFELQVNAFEAAFIREQLKAIEEMGFDVQDDGSNCFKVYSIPADLQNIDLTMFFNSILGDLHNYRAIKLEEILKDKLASAACKAAVKGGMDLTQEEAEALLVQMDGDMGLKCPHGRPVVVKMTRTQLEKTFKRIV